ncbi:MAG: NAD-dependent epimerase/dehydratase family protein [Chloroflexi bacterium]|nr:MAG: NAD-dependent epimerase/dehydratase family protein [Chloroflexota bacterium]
MKRIAITGASGYIGQRLLARLEAEPAVEQVLALDIRPLPSPFPKVTFVEHDVTRPMEELFTTHGVDTAVHLAFLVNPIHDRERERRINVGGTENFLAACHAAGVETLLMASSATVYGAWPDNPPLLPEESPLRGKPGFPYVEDKLALEALTARYAKEHPNCRVLITRAVVVAGPNVNNFLSRFLERPVMFVARGADPPVPLVHEDDVAEAKARLLLEAPAGAYNLSAPNPVRLREASRRAGTRVVALPPGLLYLLAGLAWKLRLRWLSEAPPAMLDYIRYPWTADGRKVTRVTGFRYRYDGPATLEAFLRQRMQGRR